MYICVYIPLQTFTRNRKCDVAVMDSMTYSGCGIIERRFLACITFAFWPIKCADFSIICSCLLYIIGCPDSRHWTALAKKKF